MGMKGLPKQVTDAIAASLAAGTATENGRVAPPPIADLVDEKEFQAAVRKRAKELGWRCYHTTISKLSEPGYPDLTLVRERVVWIELKKEDGRPTAEQLNWLEDLRAAGAEAYLFRPSQWNEIEAVLTRWQPGVTNRDDHEGKVDGGGDRTGPAGQAVHDPGADRPGL